MPLTVRQGGWDLLLPTAAAALHQQTLYIHIDKMSKIAIVVTDELEE